jgi:hypothetical protein
LDVVVDLVVDPLLDLDVAVDVDPIVDLAFDARSDGYPDGRRRLPVLAAARIASVPALFQSAADRSAPLRSY